MSKIEKVKIDLPSKNPPVKPYKLRNGPPSSNNFKLIPKYMPSLSHFSNVSWNCQEKTLEFNMQENARFDAYNWFSGINKRVLESQKSSFVDLEQDSLLLVIMDESQKEVVSIKFRCLSLCDHNCYFSNECSFGQNLSNCLMHFVRLKYSDSEVIPPAHIEDDYDYKIITPDRKNELVDEEWQESCNYEDVAVS